MNKFELLLKAARAQNAEDFTATELRELAVLLDVDCLFDNFSEQELRVYRDELSGQPLQGMKSNRDADNSVSSFSFIPGDKATRSQLYEGLIFSFINPAARNLCHILFWLQPSDFAKMKIGEVAGWGSLADVLTRVKDWSSHLEVVNNPGAIIFPFSGTDTTDLLVLDQLFYNHKKSGLSLDERVGEILFL